VLAACIAKSHGPVLEIGAGLYSTPYLHGACAAAERALLTVDIDADWAAKFADMERAWHAFEVCSNIGECERYADPWALAFVDCGPLYVCPTRALALDRLHHVPLVVLHDTECDHLNQYPGLAEAMSEYRFRFDYRHKIFDNQTSVFSDDVDVVEEIGRVLS
jgi:hypothetical protein